MSEEFCSGHTKFEEKNSIMYLLRNPPIDRRAIKVVDVKTGLEYCPYCEKLINEE